MLRTGVNEMPRTYRDSVTDRRAKLTPEARKRGKVFEEAYSLALKRMALRDDRGLTEAALAERCGIDQADISRIERGSTSPTARTLQRIADALGAGVRLVERGS